MQVVSAEQSHEIIAPSSQPFAWVRVEWLAYAVLIVLALLVRVASLDSAPMSDSEANQALTAWHVVHPNFTGAKELSPSVMTFWGQVIGFNVLGNGEFAARIATVFAGLGLCLVPLLFRERLGILRTFLFALILAFSPITIAASRTSDPMIWTAMFALLLLWALDRYWVSRSVADARWVGVFFGGLCFLSGGAGVICALLLLGALTACAYWVALVAPIEWDLPSEDVLSSFREMVREFPYFVATTGLVIVVFLATTGFMLLPNLGMLGQALGQAITGFWQPYNVNIPFALPLFVIVVYDLLVPIIGLCACVFLTRDNKFGADDRLALVVAIIGAFIALLYRGASPSFALFITLPFGYIIAHAISELLIDREALTYWDLVYREQDVRQNQYSWVKWVLALLVVAIFVMLGIHLQEVGRAFLTFAPDKNFFENFPRFTEAGMNPSLRSLIWFVLSLLFFVVGTFLVASIWGNYITLQGLGIGAFVIMLVSGMGGGWNAVVARASQPQEIWQSSAVSTDAMMLRKTLLEVSVRNTRIFPLIPITVVEDAEIGLTNTGLMAWTLRDFTNARYTVSIEDAKQDQIVIMRHTAEEVDLAGSYVGQSFALRSYWSVGQIPLFDWVAWLSQRMIRQQTLRYPDTVILWLRIDVYNASPIEISNP